MIILVLIATMNIIISMTLKVVDIDGTSQLLTTELAEDKTYMKWCNYWDQVVTLDNHLLLILILS